MQDPPSERDLACGGGGRWIWRTSWVLVAVGAFRPALRYWLWIPAFLAAGTACVWNVRRCGRRHCYVTGPLYLLSAAFLVAAAAGRVEVEPGVFLAVVFGVSLVARGAEWRLGRYREPARGPGPGSSG